MTCTADENCVAGKCCAKTELCDGVDNTCDGVVDEGCCPVGMTWRADLQLCFAGPFGPADWPAAQADCRNRGGCIGDPSTLGLQVCGTWLDGTRSYPHYSCYFEPDTYSNGASTCGGTAQTTACACTTTFAGCVQRYVCSSEPLLPKRLPCQTDDDCGRDQLCNATSGACLSAGAFCCETTDYCTCQRPRFTTGRCLWAMQAGG